MKLAKKKKRIGHGPGYTIDKINYPRGVKQLKMTFKKGAPITTTKKGKK